MKRIIRDRLGIIPDDHFENEPTYPAKNVSPLSQYWIDWIAAVRNAPKEKTPLLDQAMRDHIETIRVRHGSDNYQPGDVVGGY